MTEFIKAAHCSDISEGGGVVATVRGKSIAIFRIDGKFFAMGNICPHRGGPLGDGELNGFTVTCPWHAWEFDVRSGCNSENKKVVVPTFETRIDGDLLMVKV